LEKHHKNKEREKYKYKYNKERQPKELPRRVIVSRGGSCWPKRSPILRL